MDFCTLMIRKKHLDYAGEIKLQPTPLQFRNDAGALGMNMISFYENQESWYKPVAGALRKFNYFVLTQLIDGDGFFLDKKHIRTELDVGDWILIVPDYAHFYDAGKVCFIEDSIAFDGTLPRSQYRAGLFHAGVYKLGKERLLLPIIEYLRMPDLLSQYRARVELIRLLLDIAALDKEEDFTGNELYGDRIHALLQKLSENSREWNVRKMAEYCNLSMNYFRRLFQRETGMSPKAYLDALWLKSVTAKLCNSREPVYLLARQSGFEDQYYFMRRFKVLTGVTPGEYRKRYSEKK